MIKKNNSFKILGDTYIDGKDYKNDIYIAKFGKTSGILVSCELNIRDKHVALCSNLIFIFKLILRNFLDLLMGVPQS